MSYASDHARGSPTDLQMVLSDFCPVEHSVETGYLIDLHRDHVENLSYLVHSTEGEEVLILLLSHHEKRNHC